jgi:hypothetical protein
MLNRGWKRERGLVRRGRADGNALSCALFFLLAICPVKCRIYQDRRSRTPNPVHQMPIPSLDRHLPFSYLRAPPPLPPSHLVDPSSEIQLLAHDLSKLSDRYESTISLLNRPQVYLNTITETLGSKKHKKQEFFHRSYSFPDSNCCDA